MVNSITAAIETVNSVGSEHNQRVHGRDRRCIRASDILSIDIPRASGIMLFGRFPGTAAVLVGGFQGLGLAAGDASVPEALSIFFPPNF